MVSKDPATVFLNFTVTLNDGNTPDFESIDSGKLYKKDSWCKTYPYSVNQNNYVATLNYDAEVAKTFVLSPKFSTTTICDTSLVPTWTYAIEMVDGSALPSWLSVIYDLVDGGNIVLTNTCTAGTTNIRLLGVIAQTKQYYEFYFTLVGSLTPVLYFKDALVDQNVAINSPMTPYTHPNAWINLN